MVHSIFGKKKHNYFQFKSRIIFFSKKECPDGNLDKKMFLKQYRKFNPNGKPEKLCDHVFRAFDSDQNGHIGISLFVL